MRTFLRAFGGFFFGLIATYLVVVLGMFWYADVNHIVDRDGGMSMGIIFLIGPAAGVLGGIFCAIVTPIWLARRERERAAANAPPAKQWPLPLPMRISLAASVSGALVYLATVCVLWLLGGLSFRSYWTAYAVAMSPFGLGIIAAVLASLIVYRRERPF